MYQETKQEQEREESSLLPELSPLQIVVHLTEDLLSRASMTVVNGRPTLTINISTAREHWLEGMLRHEIGTSPSGGGEYLHGFFLALTYAAGVLKGRRNPFTTAARGEGERIRSRIPGVRAHERFRSRQERAFESAS